jgi:hypothetical protein
MHFPRPSVAAFAAPAIALLFAGFPAVRATSGLIGEAPGIEELLFGCGEGEICATLHAIKSLVVVAHG